MNGKCMQPEYNIYDICIHIKLCLASNFCFCFVWSCPKDYFPIVPTVPRTFVIVKDSLLPDYTCLTVTIYLNGIYLRYLRYFYTIITK